MRVCWCPFDTRWMGWHSRSLSFGYFSKTLVKGSRFSSMALGVQVTQPHGVSHRDAAGARRPGFVQSIVTVLGLVGGASGGETPRVADSSRHFASSGIKTLARVASRLNLLG